MASTTQPFSEKTQRRIGLWLMGLSLLLLAIVPWRWFVERQFLQQAHLAHGHVVELKGKPPQRAAVAFVDPQGHRRVAVAWAASSLSPAYRLNDRVAVIYLPDDPSKAKLNDPVDIWATTWLFFYLALMFGVLGGLTLRGRLAIGPLKQTQVRVGL